MAMLVDACIIIMIISTLTVFNFVAWDSVFEFLYDLVSTFKKRFWLLLGKDRKYFVWSMHAFYGL